jgi:molybdate transport system substrate-binding protein
MRSSVFSTLSVSNMSGLLSTLATIFLLSSAAGAATLTVAAASDLTQVEPALAQAFRNEPNIEVRFVTAASGVLTQQIENGAPYDVFLSANAQFVDQLASNGKLVPSSVRPYAVGRVGVLWKDGKSHPLSDLRQNSVRIVALPNPKLAPYGVAAEEALRHAQVWEFVSKKLVYGENVRQTLQLFESGNADAVLTSAALLGSKQADIIPADWHNPIVQKAGIVAGRPNIPAAQAFLQMITGPEGQAIFARFGFAKP